jgi:transposase
MAGKPKRMSQIKQLLRLHKDGCKIKSIARNLCMSKNTVKAYLTKLSESKIGIDKLLSMDDPVLEKMFHPGNPAYKDTRFDELKKDLDYYEKELKRTGVTKQLLWEEYRQNHRQGYGRSQFCHHLSQYLLNKNPSLKLIHHPAEKLYVDFAGKTFSYVDSETGEIIECQVFVACLPYSDYSFCMAVRSQKTEDFIYALECCLKSIGGVPKALVPDNLKSAVIKAHKYEPTLNRLLEDFANHYNMVVLPARARKPKDKALVENQVKLIYNRVYAKLRNRQFFSLHDLNQAIKEKVKDHNQTRMQQKNYCREECFLSEEKNLLGDLPENDFEIKYYKEYKVAKNNHICLFEDKHYYSVPYQYIGRKAKVIYTRSLVRIYIAGKQVAVHQRDFRPSKYSTTPEHLCSTHRHYLDRSPHYYKNRALHIDNRFHQLIEKVFEQNKYPEQLYRTCDGLFSLQRKTDTEIFRKACAKSLKYKNYSYGFLFNIIKNRMTEMEETQRILPLPEHPNIRGKNYYT